MKAFFQPVVKLTQAEVDAGATSAPVSARILIVDGSNNLTGAEYSKTATGVVTAGGGASGNYEKIQIATANYALAPSSQGKTRIFHIESGGGLAAITATSWPTPAGIDTFEIQNHSGANQDFIAGTGYTGSLVGFDNNPIETDIFTIKSNTAIQVRIDSDGFIQIMPSYATYTKAEIDTALQGKAGTASATTSVNGLMSSADKTKLDGVATSAAAVATTGTPAMDGTGTLGTATTSAHSDHIHPTDTSREATASKGVANGYAGLGADARVPFAQLPESVGIGFRLWTPADLGTTRAIDLDFEAATLGALASIVNQGNLGGTADQSVVGEQPMVDTIDATGRRGCLFDGTNDSLRSSAIWSLGTTYGLFAVYRRAATGAGMLISTEYPTNVAYAAGQVQDAVNNGSGGNMVFIGHFNGAWRSAAVNSVLASALGIFCGNFDGTNLNARLFGTDSLVAQTSLSGIPTGNTRIGRRWDTAGNNYFSGRVFRVIGKAGAWTTGEMQLLEGWAAHRMGASANLPSAHPYRNSPPIVAL